jgi:molybdate transport system substrate-binding protein
MAGATDIRVLSVGAVQNAVRALAAQFSQESGNEPILTFAAPAAVMQKLKAGEAYDALIASEAAMDELDGNGLVNPESRVKLASTGLGIAVRAGSPAPDLSTADAFRQALLAAPSIVYGDPSLPYQSGQRIEKMLAKAGLLESLRPKLRIVPGLAASQEMIARGEATLGLYNASEIVEARGVSFAGPVPAPLQVDTAYEGALLSDGSVPEAARAFIEFLAGAGARSRWVDARFAPLGDR